MGRTQAKDAKGRLISLVPPRLVLALAVVAFVTAGILLAGGLVWPERFEHSTARFLLCAAVALNLAIFFFIIYPQDVKLTKVPVINVSVPLVGPIVLFILMLLFLWTLMPEPPTVARRFFIPYEGGQRAERISFDTVKITPAEESFTYYVVPNDRRFLAGVYVEFGRGKEQYKALFAAPFYKPVEITFQRGPGEGRFEVERAESR
jgi:hypothetical protein